MNTYLVSYDLRTPGRDYKTLHEAIKSYDYWAKPLESVWFVRSEQSAGVVRDALKKKIDANDKLLVVEVGGRWGTFNVVKNVTDWMKRNLKSLARL